MSAYNLSMALCMIDTLSNTFIIFVNFIQIMNFDNKLIAAKF